MGTNFFWIDPTEEPFHVGKRCGAGNFCFTCNRSLVTEQGASTVCPTCGGKSQGPQMSIGKRPSAGVFQICSFIWADDPARVQAICERKRDIDIILDETGVPWTGSQFASMLFAHCPIQDTDSIGKTFF